MTEGLWLVGVIVLAGVALCWPVSGAILKWLDEYDHAKEKRNVR